MPDADIITNFSKALYLKFTAAPGGVHNDFYNAVNGRLYEGQAPDGASYPYSVYLIVTVSKDKTFTEEYTDITLQLSIFSSASSSSEVKLAYHYAYVLFDECEFDITGSTLVWLRETNLVPIIEDHTTDTGTQKVWHYAADYEVLTSLD